MADTTFRTVLPALKAVDNGDSTYSVAVSIAGMPPLTGLTAGEVLVALTATTAGWQSTGVVLDAPDISGVVTAAAPLTLPAFTMGGNLDMSTYHQTFANTAELRWRDPGAVARSILSGNATNVFLVGNLGGSVVLQTTTAAGAGNPTNRFYISGSVATAVATWVDVTHTGIVLSGALTLGGQVFDAGATEVQVSTTGGGQGVYVTSTQDAATGGVFTGHVKSANPAAADALVLLKGVGRTSTAANVQYGTVGVYITNPANAAFEGEMRWTLALAAGNNTAMTLSGAGVISPDHSILFGQSQDSALVANQVSLGGYEIAANRRTLSLSTEEPLTVEAVGASDRTLAIRHNGATIKIMCHT